MPMDLSILIQIDEDVTERLAQLVFQTEFKQMLDYAWQLIPENACIDVTAPERHDLGGELVIHLECYLLGPASTDALLNQEPEVDRWFYGTFEPEICQNFVLTLHAWSQDGP